MFGGGQFVVPGGHSQTGFNLAAGLSARALKVRVRSGGSTAVKGPVPLGIGGDGDVKQSAGPTRFTWAAPDRCA